MNRGLSSLEDTAPFKWEECWHLSGSIDWRAGGEGGQQAAECYEHGKVNHDEDRPKGVSG